MTPDPRAPLLDAQYREALRRLPIACWGKLLLAPLALAYFWADVGPGLLLAALFMYLPHHLAQLWLAWRPPQSLQGVRSAWRLGFIVASSGLMDALLVRWLTPLASPTEQLVIVGTLGGAIALGAWLFAPLRHAGLGWTLSATLGTAAALASLGLAQYGALVLLLVFHGALLVVTVLATEREFVERLQAQQQLARQHELVGLLLHDFEQDASDWLWETDAQLRLTHVPPHLATALGRHVDDLQGVRLPALLATLSTDGAAVERLTALLATGQALRDQPLAVRLPQGERWWSLKARPLRDEAGQATGWRGVVSDVTALVERDQQLLRQAREDALTGLANRHGFAQALRERQEQPLVLLLFDLDNFKQVNDSLGHDAGDELLVWVARRLRAACPPEAFAARLGGDEFAVLLDGAWTDETVSAWHAELVRRLAEPLLIAEHQVEVHASVGAARRPEHAGDADALLRAADLALYAAKAEGRRRLRFFDISLQQRAQHKLQWLTDLRLALREPQWVLHYQPKVLLAGERLVGFEALLRWQHPAHGLVAPAQFIPLAEESGLIVPLGDWVLREACGQAAQWPEPLGIAVNVAAQELERGDLVERVEAALLASGLAPQRLTLELTETTLLRDLDATTRWLTRLRERGVRIALDDFGTGFSSLAYLRSFPVDELKIDRSFVRPLDLPDEAEDALAILQQVQGLADALRLTTVAEGVETASQRHALAALGCDVAQGFHFARALSAVDAARFIALAESQGLNAARHQVQGAALPPEHIGPRPPAARSTPPLAPDSRWVGL